MHCKLRQRSLRENGLTLRETLLTLSLVAVPLSIGLPAFQDQIAHRRARAAAEQLYAVTRDAVFYQRLRGGGAGV